MIWLICLSLAIIFSLVNIILSKKPRTAANIIEIVLLYLFVFQVGVMCLLAYINHVFNGAAISALIGWAPGSPFQYEVGMMNLGEGVLGILCIWFRKDFWLATAIVASVTMVGCGVGHVREIIFNNNWSPYNAGPGIWIQTVLLPIALLTLVYFYRKLKKA
jgi:predicted membrane channel-forming protein YqfA (hemolysin III family)